MIFSLELNQNLLNNIKSNFLKEEVEEDNENKNDFLIDDNLAVKCSISRANKDFEEICFLKFIGSQSGFGENAEKNEEKPPHQLSNAMLRMEESKK